MAFRKKRRAFVVGSTSGGSNSDITAVFGNPPGPTGSASNDATSRSRTPFLATGAGKGLVRVTFKAASGSALTVDNAAVGVWDGVAAKADTLLTPIELLFAGVSGFALGAGAQIISDWAVVAGMTRGVSLVVVVDYGAANGNAVAEAGQATPAANYFHAAANSFNTTVTPAGSTETLNVVNDFIRIEIQ